MLSGTHHWPAQERVHYGRAAAEAVAAEVERARAARVFVTTTRSLSGGALLAGIVRTLDGRFAGKFDAIAAHSPREAVLAGAEALRAAAADLVVAVGGGSVIDATKAMLLALWRDTRTPEAFAALAGRRGQAPEASAWSDDPQPLRMIAVPTTLSAAEFFISAGITDTARRVKEMYAHPLMVPKAVVLDPAATLETPMPLLLSSGVRSVDHAVEGWCAAKRVPIADAANREAMRLLAQALPAIQRDPADLEARALAQHATWLSRIGSMAGVPYGASHGIGYLLGGGRGLPHGITSCVALPAVLEWNEPATGARQQEVAAAFGHGRERAAEALRRFIAGLGLPTRLREVGIAREELAEIAASWDGGAPISTNPRPVRSQAELAEILELAW
jgi:maleylacetate reductase